MMSEKLKKLLEQYNEQQKVLHLLHREIKETLEVETNGKLSLCGGVTSDVHVYCSCGEHFDVLKELADEGTMMNTHNYEDGTSSYTFTMNGVYCLAIGPTEED